MTAEERTQQQQRALELAGLCHQKASEFRQAGFKYLAAEAKKSAKGFERYAMNIAKRHS